MVTDLMVMSVTGLFFFPTGVFSIASSTSKPSITLWQRREDRQARNPNRNGRARKADATHFANTVYWLFKCL